MRVPAAESGRGFGGSGLKEVGDYIRAAANVEPPRELLNRIYEQTEGNPFFLSEVVNVMTEEDTWSADSVSDIAIPEGAREALGRRLDRISEDANELLTVAGVVGREFTYDTLQLLVEHDDEILLRLIEECLEARVIEEDDEAGRYRFSHDLVQQTLLEELSTTRRVRLHGEVAQALEERYGENADARASRLAQHYRESATLNRGHAERAAHYGLLAGEQAAATAAWAEAARHYEQCLALVTESEDGLGQDEAALLLELARSVKHAGDVPRSVPFFEQAFERFRERGDGVSAASAGRSGDVTPRGLNIRGPHRVCRARAGGAWERGSAAQGAAAARSRRVRHRSGVAGGRRACSHARRTSRPGRGGAPCSTSERASSAFAELRLEEAVALAQRAFEPPRGARGRAPSSSLARSGASM